MVEINSSAFSSVSICPTGGRLEGSSEYIDSAGFKRSAPGAVDGNGGKDEWWEE